MNTLARIPAVFVFEWRRALTLPRLAWLAALSLFAPGLLLFVRVLANEPPPMEIAAISNFILCTSVTSVMAVFLWATPAIASELEGRSWVYLSVRPHGPMAVLMGKYLVAVSWALPVTLTSSLLGSLFLGVQDASQSPRLIAASLMLGALSCVSYAALFILIGVVAPARAMVVGVAYTLVAEVALGFIPAAVNMFTIQYRLRCLLVRWIDFPLGEVRENPVFTTYFSADTVFYHVSILILMTLAMLIASGLILKFREFTSSSETEAG